MKILKKNIGRMAVIIYGSSFNLKESMGKIEEIGRDYIYISTERNMKGNALRLEFFNKKDIKQIFYLKKERVK